MRSLEPGAQASRPASATLRGLRWYARYRLGEHRAYLPIARWRHPGSVIDEHTRLVIDGFTRSGVTFALFAFHLAQLRPVRVAHHLHAAVHLTEATRRRVPGLLVVREPKEATLSTLVREPYLTPSQVLRAYTHFHRRLLVHAHALVVADFTSVTGDFGRVIDRVNGRYGTSFDLFEHTQENVARVFQLIEDRHRRPPWSLEVGLLENGKIGLTEYEAAVECHGGRAVLGPPVETRVARPSATREAAKDRLRDQVHAHARLLAAAEDAYRDLVSAG